MSRRRGASPDPVERYLRQLGRWAPRATRQELLAEARRHLYEATQQGERRGMPRHAAQQAALERFGPAWQVGLAAHGWMGNALLHRLFRPHIASSWLLRATRVRFFLPARVHTRHPRAFARRPNLGRALRRHCRRSWQSTSHTWRRLTRR